MTSQSINQSINQSITQSINNAISASGTMLSIQDYISTTNFNIDTLVFNRRFWSTMHDDMPMYIDDTLIRWCGYEGESRNARMTLMRLMKRHDIKCMQLSNAEYNQFKTNQKSVLPSASTELIYHIPDLSNGKNRTKHLLLYHNNHPIN